MKTNLILLSVALSALALPASAIKLPESLTSKLTESSAVTELAKGALTSYAAEQLGMSEAMVGGGLASIFKVAQDNLTTENFSELSSAIPDMSAYLDLAPELSTSAISSLLGDSATSKAAQSASYLDSAFESLGIPKESLPLMISTVTSYLDGAGYGDAASMLKKGLNFL
jgi:hypothetical protein